MNDFALRRMQSERKMIRQNNKPKHESSLDQRRNGDGEAESAFIGPSPTPGHWRETEIRSQPRFAHKRCRPATYGLPAAEPTVDDAPAAGGPSVEEEGTGAVATPISVTPAARQSSITLMNF